MEIVELGPADVQASLEDLAQLLLDAHDAGAALGVAGPLTRERARLVWVETAERLEPGHRVLLGALEGGRVVGTVQIARATVENGAHRAEVQRLVVRRGLQGRGIGRALIDAAVERAAAMDLRLLWLTTHADSDADGFYERCGWTRVGVIPSYAVRPDGSLVGNAFYYREI
jgi:ribosomal protein S18 acetylase RimI-like enzyme